MGLGISASVRFPAEAIERFFSPRHLAQTGPGAHPASYPIGIWGSSLGAKWPEHEADHSLPSSAKVKECVEL